MSWGTNEKGTNEMGDQWEGGPVSGSPNDVHPHPHVSAWSCSRCYATITNASRWVPDVFPMSFLATSAGGRRMSGRPVAEWNLGIGRGIGSFQRGVIIFPTSGVFLIIGLITYGRRQGTDRRPTGHRWHRTASESISGVLQCSRCPTDHLPAPDRWSTSDRPIFGRRPPDACPMLMQRLQICGTSWGRRPLAGRTPAGRRF